MSRKLTLIALLLVHFLIANQTLAQTFVVLNNNNNFTDELEPAVVIQRSGGFRDGQGPLSGINLEFSCSTCDVADFSDAVTQIGGVGGGVLFCNHTFGVPLLIVRHDDQLCARSTISSSKFDIDLLTWDSGATGCTENPIGGCTTSQGFTSYLRTSFATPSDLLESLISDIMDLNLTQGIANSIDAKINTALQALDDLNQNNDVAAINAIQAFINAVQAQRGNQISEADADVLIANAQAIIDLLST